MEGYEVLDMKIYIETQNQDMYGRINSIVLDLYKKGEADKKEESLQNENKVNEIEDVKISISETKQLAKENTLNNDEINSLKELLYNSYSIEKTRIHINE